MWCWCVWAGDECGGVCGVRVYGLGMSAKVSQCGVGVYGLGLSAKVSVVSVCMGWGGVRRCLWCRCVWAGDESGGVCGVGAYGLGMSEGCLVLSVCMGWGRVRRCLW